MLTNRRGFLKFAAALPLVGLAIKKPERSNKLDKLKHLYISPEALEDIRSWDLMHYEEIVRQDMFGEKCEHT